MKEGQEREGSQGQIHLQAPPCLGCGDAAPFLPGKGWHVVAEEGCFSDRVKVTSPPKTASQARALCPLEEGWCCLQLPVVTWVIKFQMKANYWRGAEKLEFVQVYIGT